MVHLMSLVLFQSETQIKAVFQMHARKDNSVFQDYLLLIFMKRTGPRKQARITEVRLIEVRLSQLLFFLEDFRKSFVHFLFEHIISNSVGVLC